jgi:hypothetical protein
VRTSTLLGVMVVATLAPAIAHAQDAEALFEQGKQLAQQGLWPEACAQFRASMDLDPSVGALLKIARCHERDGKLRNARDDYEAALRLSDQKRDATEQRRAQVEAYAREGLSRLDSRIPHLRVRVSAPPPDLHVRANGEDLPLSRLGESMAVDPGPIDLVAEAPGYQTERRSVVVEEGGTSEVMLTLGPVPAAPATPSPPAELRTLVPLAPGPAAIPSRAVRTTALGLGIGGIAVLGVAGVLGIETLSKVGSAKGYCDATYHCSPPGFDLLHEAAGDQTGGFIALGVGSALLAGGLALALTTHAPHSETHTVSVVVSPRGAALRGAW